MTTITYSTEINTFDGNYKTISATEYEQLCRVKGSCYELIPDDVPVKFYFDIDIKEDYDPTLPSFLNVMHPVIEMAKDCIRDYVVNIVKTEPVFAVKSANSECFMCSKDHIEKLAVSLHLIVDNVVVLKSDQDKIVKKLNQYARQKYVDLDDYIGKGKNDEVKTLFDESVYSRKRKMRSPYATKEGENRPFILEEGTFEQSCISAFIPADATLYQLPAEPVRAVQPINDVISTSSGSVNRLAFESGLLSGLLNTASTQYTPWRNVGFALKYEFGHEEGWPLFDEFSKLCSSKYDVHSNKEFWDNIKPDHSNPVKFGTIMQLMKEADIDKFKTLQGQLKEATDDTPKGCVITLEEEETPVPKRYISLETLDKGENDIARHISKTLIEILVFCNNKWFLFDKNTCLWRSILNPSAMIITTIQTYIDHTKISILKQKLDTDDEEEKKKFTNFEKKYNEFYKQVGKGGFTSQIIKILQDYLFDGEFERKLDTTPYLVAYKNGLYDLKTGKFRKGIKYTDYLTQTIPYNYESATETDITAVKNELLKICNNNPQHLEYYLSSLGYAMTGDSSREQSFWNIRGQKACNGKSVVFDALINIIPNYIVKMESDIFEVNYGSRHKEISTWKGVRIGYINELSKKRQDENVLKELADGTCMRFKVMYGGMDTMPITLKLWIVGNSTMKVNADNGIKRRLKMLQFDSEFVADLDEDNFETGQFKKDLNFGMLLQTKYKHALMELIYQYSKKYVDNHYKLCDYPKAWLEECEDVARDNNKFEEYFYNHFEIDPNGTVSKRVVDYIISGYKEEKVIIKDELKKMKIAFTYESQTRGNKEKNRGLYLGFKETKYDNESFGDETDQETTEL